MKRFYFFIFGLFVISLTSCRVQNTSLVLQKTTVQRSLLKEYFLCVCITEGFKDEQITDKDISQAIYFDILQYSPEAIQIVRDSAVQFVGTIRPSPIIDLNNKRAIIMMSIEKYKSKELDRLVKSLDKYLIHD
ncbi:MAG: hypothetical protein IJ154_06305 [Bacteroidales bacterium]|nr:hypothetical protein [Bacteroidales bacterium]